MKKVITKKMMTILFPKTSLGKKFILPMDALVYDYNLWKNFTLELETKFVNVKINSTGCVTDFTVNGITHLPCTLATL